MFKKPKKMSEYIDDDIRRIAAGEPTVCSDCTHHHRDAPHLFCWCGCTYPGVRLATPDEIVKEELITKWLSIKPALKRYIEEEEKK